MSFAVRYPFQSVDWFNWRALCMLPSQIDIKIELSPIYNKVNEYIRRFYEIVMCNGINLVIATCVTFTA